MNKLIAKRDFRHGRLVIRAGDRFEASPVDAEYYTQFEFAAPDGDAPVTMPSKRRYNRRDMQAEDGRSAAAAKQKAADEAAALKEQELAAAKQKAADEAAAAAKQKAADDEAAAAKQKAAGEAAAPTQFVVSNVAARRAATSRQQPITPPTEDNSAQ